MSESAFRSKPVVYKGVLFDGTNSPEVAAWIREKGGAARAGGSYVKVLTEPETYDWENMKQGDWVIHYGDGVFGIYADEHIDLMFVRKVK